jgi:hypothetical protein
MSRIVTSPKLRSAHNFSAAVRIAVLVWSLDIGTTCSEARVSQCETQIKHLYEQCLPFKQMYEIKLAARLRRGKRIVSGKQRQQR